MKPSQADLLGVDDSPKSTAPVQFARVADLATHFGVERGDVEDDGGLSLGGDYFQHFRGRYQFIVAHKLRRRGGLDLGEFDDLLFLGGAGAGFLFLHQLVEASDINSETSFASNQLSEVEGETIGVVKFEREVGQNICVGVNCLNRFIFAFYARVGRAVSLV